MIMLLYSRLSVVVFSLALALPCIVDGLRGSPRKQGRDLHEDDGVAVVVEYHESHSRLLAEEVPCVPMDSISVMTQNHELSDHVCVDNQCDEGCCRFYFWLICDKDNAFPDVPCICNDRTKNPDKFDPTPAPTTTSEDGEENVVLEDEGQFTVEYEPDNSNPEKATIPPTPKPPAVAPTTTPVLSTPPASPATAPSSTISVGACLNGSPYEDNPAFADYTVCQTSYDCTGLGFASRKKNKDKNNKYDDDEDSEDDEDEDIKYDVMSTFEEQGSYCCLANMCLCGEPPNGEWGAHCVPPYSMPSTTTTSSTTTNNPVDTNQNAQVIFITLTTPPAVEPTAKPPTIPITTTTPAAPVTTVMVNSPTQRPAAAAIPLVEMTPPHYFPPPVSKPTSTPTTTEKLPTTSQQPVTSVIESGIESPPEEQEELLTTIPQDDVTTACSDGSDHWNQKYAVGYKKCITNANCRQYEEDQCCLKDFCFCGSVEDSINCLGE